MFGTKKQNKKKTNDDFSDTMFGDYHSVLLRLSLIFLLPRLPYFLYV